MAYALINIKTPKQNKTKMIKSLDGFSTKWMDVVKKQVNDVTKIKRYLYQWLKRIRIKSKWKYSFVMVDTYNYSLKSSCRYRTKWNKIKEKLLHKCVHQFRHCYYTYCEIHSNHAVWLYRIIEQIQKRILFDLCNFSTWIVRANCGTHRMYIVNIDRSND